MGGRTKNATKMIIEGPFCSVLKGQDQFRTSAANAARKSSANLYFARKSAGKLAGNFI
ncbi:hypothetical protein MTR_1g112600 [Medicago truncatula]|uniref:Uncharacterized protein n=1 Tax=Medicago truncatula TaxID=3880 RepID=A0A072VRT4_MEDTR|nr:hypothetical protein MTR_1g112600 [Medicago truncatula]